MRHWHATIFLQNGGRYWLPFEVRVQAAGARIAAARAVTEAMAQYRSRAGRNRITGYKLTMFPITKRPGDNALPMEGLEPKEVTSGPAA